MLALKAVTYFRTLEEAAALAEANKRVSNILAKSANVKLNDTVLASVLKAPEEVQLAANLSVYYKISWRHYLERKYQEA